ncbi:DapH/DapD/GlmU-related protein [Pediococcus acidilactici]
MIDPEVVLQNDEVDQENTWIRSYSVIKNSTIASDVFIGFKCSIANSVVGQRAQIANSCVLGSLAGRKVYIENDVWIGAQTSVDAGVHIGKGAVVGAGAHVIDNVRPFSVVIGSPAAVLKKREIKGNRQQLSNAAFLAEIRELFKQEPPQFKDGYANYTGKEISADLKVGKGAVISGRPSKHFLNGGFRFEKNIIIGPNSILEGAGGIRIGSNVNLKSSVVLITTTHDYHYLSLPTRSASIQIGRNVVIGENSIIFPGTKIPDNVTIPPNAIVLKNLKIKRRGN